MPSNSKEVRYDRQLRLWGDGGQRKLEQAKICLLGATATGAEILKSLVLPGIGSFTIVDNFLIDQTDVDVSFFVDRSKIGLKRAEIVRDFLLELNSDVKGNVIFKNPNSFFESENEKSILNQFDVVIGTDLSDKTALDISDYLWARRIPFVLCKCYGLIAKLRLVLPEHHVIETHPDFLPPCFHLDSPWPDFQAFLDSIDLTKLTHEKHSHTPYVILLAKAVEKWRTENPDKIFPTAYSDKTAIKKILLSMRMPDEKGHLEEENFQEAINSTITGLSLSTIPESCNRLLNDNRAVNLAKNSHNFWILCKALRQFVENNGRKLPLRGDLPDMISDSDVYVQLQNLFHTQAEKEARQVYEITLALCQELGVDPETRITLEETKLFCKNAAFLRVLETRKLSEEFDQKSSRLNEIWQHLEEGDPADKSFFDWYIALRASERFYAEKARYPGTNGIPEHLDKNDLLCRVRSLLKDNGLPQDIEGQDTVGEEMCRYGASEIHVVASQMGGIAAQEVIKIVTKQYIPLNNTLIFDGNRSDVRVFEF